MDSKERIRQHLASMTSSPVADSDDIFSRGLVNSLAALQLVLFIEEEFHVKVDVEDLDLDNFCSIDAMDAFVARKLQGSLA